MGPFLFNEGLPWWEVALVNFKDMEAYHGTL